MVVVEEAWNCLISVALCNGCLLAAVESSAEWKSGTSTKIEQPAADRKTTTCNNLFHVANNTPSFALVEFCTSTDEAYQNSQNGVCLSWPHLTLYQEISTNFVRLIRFDWVELSWLWLLALWVWLRWPDFLVFFFFSKEFRVLSDRPRRFKCRPNLCHFKLIDSESKQETTRWAFIRKEKAGFSMRTLKCRRRTKLSNNTNRLMMALLVSGCTDCRLCFYKFFIHCTCA